MHCVLLNESVRLGSEHLNASVKVEKDREELFFLLAEKTLVAAEKNDIQLLQV